MAATTVQQSSGASTVTQGASSSTVTQGGSTTTVQQTTNGTTVTASTTASTVQQTTTATTVTASTASATVVTAGGPTGTAGPGAVDNIRYLSTFANVDNTGATDSAAGINAALTTCAAGNIALVVDGVYLCSSPISVPSNSNIIGLGWDSSVLTFDWTLYDDGNQHVGASSASDISISNLQITGAHDGTPWGSGDDSGRPVAGIRLVACTDSRVEGVRVYRVAGLSIAATAAKRVQIRGCEILEGGRDGIHVAWTGTSHCEDVTVEGNLVRTVGDDGIAIWNGNSTTENGTTGTASTTAGSTTLTGSGTSWAAGNVGERIVIDEADNGAAFEAVISAVTNATTLTLDRKAPSTVSSKSIRHGFARNERIVVSGNTVIQQDATDSLLAGRGIVVGGGEGVVVEGNTVSSTHGIGISMGEDDDATLLYSQSCIVQGNTITDAGQVKGSTYPGTQHGIRLYGTRSCIAAGNTVVRAVDQGIYVARSTDVTVTGNTVADCGEESGDAGIQLDGVSGQRRVQRATVTGNTVRRSYTAGIRVNYCTNVVVSGNVCTDNGRGGDATTADSGIVVRGDGRWTIADNICTDTRTTGNKTQTRGIFIGADGGSPTLMLSGNNCVGNSVAGIVQNNTTATVYQVNNLSSVTDQWEQPFEVAGVKIGVGTGSPEGARTAPVGSLFLRSNGGASTTLYVKESGTGNTGWVAK